VPVLYLGYLIMMHAREAILLLQFAHALQYLIFPLRVEINRAEVSSLQRRRTHLLVYLVGLIAVGYLVFIGLGQIPSRVAWLTAALLVSMINIHHYYIDGCVWKISTPEVRGDLFKHLRA